MSIKVTGILLILLFLLACRDKSNSVADIPDETTQKSTYSTDYAMDQSVLRQLAEDRRLAASELNFEEFKARVYKEPFDDGKFIVNGDTPIQNEKYLREFFERKVKVKAQQPQGHVPEFIIHTVAGLDAVWSWAKKNNLTYCVSDRFEQRYTDVVNTMDRATKAWEAAADIDFIHIDSQDSDCTENNANVVFDVRPIDVDGNYLARAFFPNERRRGRNILIDNSSFALDPNGALSLTGILRHELGHTIGARHEHTRPDSGECFEDVNWRPITNYDAFSVMHYPHCNGRGDWRLTLTAGDKNGAACVYGPADGFVIDTDICEGPEPAPSDPAQSGIARNLSFENQAVSLNEEKRYATLRVLEGTPFRATMQSIKADTGDPDIYLSFNATPQRAIEFDCRPYLVGADEECDLIVPRAASVARIMVHGFSAGKFKLNVNYVEPGGE